MSERGAKLGRSDAELGCWCSARCGMALNGQTPAEVMLDAAKTNLRAGRFPPGEVIRRQLDALDRAGYHLEPPLADAGADLLLQAAKRALRAGHFSPAAVISRQLVAVGESGHSFVKDGEHVHGRCESYVWGPESFEACARCGLSYWKHPGNAGHGGGAHRQH